jgi:hypothetical protein
MFVAWWPAPPSTPRKEPDDASGGDTSRLSVYNDSTGAVSFGTLGSKSEGDDQDNSMGDSEDGGETLEGTDNEYLSGDTNNQ